MLKRLTAILVMLAMLFGMCAVVSADTADPYEYLPRDITIVCNKNDNSGVVVAWKNPTSSALSKVTVTDTGNGNVIGTVEKLVPGGISRVASETASVQFGMFKAKFLFEFSNGEKREFYYTQDKRNYGLKNDFYTPKSVAIDQLNDYNVFTTNSQNATENGKNSLMIVSNINPDVNGNRAAIGFNYKAGNNFPVAGSLKSETSYNFEYKIKTESSVSFDNYINAGGAKMSEGSGKVEIAASSEWQTVSGSFKTVDLSTLKDAGYAYFTIGFKQATDKPFYIDDVKITELDENGAPYIGSDTTSYIYNFEDITKTMAKPTNVTASASDGMATISWTADESVGRYINIYEITDSGKVLMDRMCCSGKTKDTSVDINYLKNGKTYKFAVSAMTFEGIESEAEEVEVTPVKQVASKYEFEPANILISDWRKESFWLNDAHKGYAVSWINPTAEMTSVKLYEINGDGTETEKTPNRVFMPGNLESAPTSNLPVTTPGAVVRFENQPTESESGTATYRLMFEFNDGQKRDIIYSGAWKGTGGYRLIQATDKVGNIGMYGAYDKGQIQATDKSNNKSWDSLGSASIANISQKKVTNNSNVSLELYSNQVTKYAGRQLDISLSSNLTNGTTYNFSMDVNTIQSGMLKLGKTVDVKIPNTNGKWQNVTGTFEANGTFLQLKPGMAMREMYIDNIRVWSGDDSANVATYSFKDVTKSIPEDVKEVSATQGEKTNTTLSWIQGGGQYTKVYEDIDEDTTDDIHTWVLRARVPSAQTSLTLNNLETDKTHNFMITTEKSGDHYNGLESDGVFCSATLVMPDYEIEDVYMLADDEPIEKLIPGNTYTAQAKISNAKCAEGLKAQVIVAVYADGVLDSFAVSDLKTVAVDNTETVTVPSFTIGNDTNKKYTAKIMVWKGLSSATPLVNGSVPYTE